MNTTTTKNRKSSTSEDSEARQPGHPARMSRMVAALAAAGLMVACVTAPPAGDGSTAASGQTGSAGPSYAKDVAPILKEKCTACHGGLVAQKGLKLTSRSAIMKGGESGPAVVPGAPSQSPLYTALSLPVSDIRHMPPLASEKVISAAEKATLRDWIAAGAN